MELTHQDMQNMKIVKRQIQLILNNSPQPTQKKTPTKCHHCFKPSGHPQPHSKSKSKPKSTSISARNYSYKKSPEFGSSEFNRKKEGSEQSKAVNKPSYELFYNSGHKKQNEEKKIKTKVYKEKLDNLEERLNVLRSSKESKTSMEYFKAMGQLKRRG